MSFTLSNRRRGARMYDAASSRWNGVDALREKYTAWSPYNYVFNNPLIFVDPTGEDGRLAIEGTTITYSTRIHVFGSEASQEKVDQLNARWESLNNVYQGEVFTVKIEVEYVLSATVDANDDAHRSPKGYVYSNYLSEELKQSIGFEPGDNLLEIDSESFERTNEMVGGTGGAEGLTPKIGASTSMVDPFLAVVSGIHEVGHQLGFVDRYDRLGAYGVVRPGYEGEWMSNEAAKVIHPQKFFSIIEKAVEMNGGPITLETLRKFILNEVQLDKK